MRKIAKDHGDDAAEARRDQSGVSVDADRVLPQIISAPDRIEDVGVSDIGRPVVRLVKRIDDLEYWAVFEARKGRRMMALQSMWIRGRPLLLRP